MKLTLLASAVGLAAAWGALGMECANSELQGKIGPICKSHAERADDGALNYTETSKSAIDALNTLYNSSEGRWAPEVAWWISGVALQGILDYSLKTGSYEYIDQANDIIEKQKEPLAWWPEGEGLFRADSTDDTAWWALALVRMFDISGDSWCLDTAKTDEEYMYQYWTDGNCGGGLVQSIRTKTYKNAISNQLYALLTASLHNRIPDDTEYLDKAKAAWEWLFSSGMLNEDHLFNDGLTKDDDDVCVNNNGTVWTYNQGVILGAATGKPPTPFLSLYPHANSTNRALQSHLKHHLPYARPPHSRCRPCHLVPRTRWYPRRTLRGGPKLQSRPANLQGHLYTLPGRAGQRAE